MRTLQVSDTGYWIDDNPPNLFFDKKLCQAIYKFIKKNNIKSLVDFGCGKADYVKYFIKKGIYCQAFDGNPYTEIITNKIGKIIDLAHTFDLDQKFDCVLSLETGEHIPIEYEQFFIDNICKHTNKFVIISWAIPGQGGAGHYNERSNRYIINEFEKRKFMINGRDSLLLRENLVFNHFKNTLMVFEKI